MLVGMGSTYVKWWYIENKNLRSGYEKEKKLILLFVKVDSAIRCIKKNLFGTKFTEVS